MLVYVLPGTLESLEDHLELLWDAGATGLEERGGVVRAYFAERQQLEGPLSGGEWTEEEDQDWQAAFKRDLRPVQAGRITIAPPWLADEVPATQLPLIIEPGMAFGTGHHATTRLAVQALSDLELSGKQVLDVGTGSGVLAMAAALLGAQLAYGVDIDPQTIPVARANAQHNGLYAPQVQFKEGTLNPSEFAAPAGHTSLAGQGYDVLVANLFAELHDLLAATYLLHLRPGGQLILTGILEDRLDVVLAALSREGVQRVEVQQDGEWALVTGHKAGQGGLSGMRLTRVRVPAPALDPEVQGTELVLTGPEVRHLGVMRLRPGDALLVFDGQGREARAELLALEDLRAKLRLIEELSGTPETPQPVTLAIALLKGDKLADVVRAATELGVARIQLLVTQHADVRDIGASKLIRLNRIAAEASKQSRRAVTPEVLAPVPLGTFTWQGQAYVAHPYVHDLLTDHLHWGSPVTLLTGPEGGFSEAEMKALTGRGAQGVVLGPRILRAETAPVALLGAVAATGV